MKKLLLLSFFVLAAVIAVQAQTLTWKVYNSSATETWHFKFVDSNGNLEDHFIAPGQLINGFVPAGVVLPPFYFKGLVNATGCYFNQTLIGFGSGSTTTTCGSTVNWSLQDWGGGNYGFKMSLP